MITLRRLQYFTVIAEELHFGHAAERLRISQPPLSQQIRRLEQEVDAELFHRTRRSVRLSPAGQALLPYARQALQAVASGIDAAQHAERGEVGNLAIGFVESAAVEVLPRAVRSLRASRPGVKLDLRTLSVGDQIQELRDGTLELAIIRLPVDSSGLDLLPVLEESLVVAIPDVHPLARQERVSLNSLAGEPLVLLAREVVPALHDLVIASFVERELEPRLGQSASTIQAVLGLVAAGLGVSLLARSASGLEREGIVFVPLAESPRLTLAVATAPSEPTPAREAFLDALLEAGRAVEEKWSREADSAAGAGR